MKIEQYTNKIINAYSDQFLKQLPENSIDLVVTSSAAALNPDIKKEAEKYFEGKTIVSPYEVLGETLGAALAINILYAALKLKKENLHTALVGNYDITGEYITYLIRR